MAISLFPNGGFWFGLALAALFNMGAYFFSDKMALAMSRAKPVTEDELPEVYGIVRFLSETAEMPMPRIYLIDSPQPNAFATGRNPRHGVVAVTTGLLQIMSPGELEGVLAHELSHIRNRDILISSVAAMIAAALTILARMAFWFGGGGRDRNNQAGAIIMIVAMIVAPIAAILIRMGHLPVPGVPGGPFRSGSHRPAAAIGVRPGEDRDCHRENPHAGQRRGEPALHREPAEEQFPAGRRGAS